MIKNENKLLEVPDWLVNEMIAYLYTSGLLIKSNDLSSAVHLPVVIFPSPVKFYKSRSLNVFLRKSSFTKSPSTKWLIRCQGTTSFYTVYSNRIIEFIQNF
jgi:hypothetical protein